MEVGNYLTPFNVSCEFLLENETKMVVQIRRHLLEDQFSKGHVFDALSENRRCEQALVSFLRKQFGILVGNQEPSIYF
jgi:hypothetical protein